MQSTVIDSQVFGYLFSTDEMRNVFSDRAWVQKFLDMEAALAKAQGELGVIPKEKADIINEYAKAELLDLPLIGEYIKSSITIVPVLKAFKKVLPDDAGEYVHWGATSQDVYDTALVLMERDAYEIIVRDMKECLKNVSISSGDSIRNLTSLYILQNRHRLCEQPSVTGNSIVFASTGGR